MAFTRQIIRDLAMESGIEIPKELADALVSAHMATRDAYAEEQVKAELEKQANTKPKNVKDSEEYKTLKAEFDKYKEEITAKETKKAKTDAYRELLKGANIDEKRIATILRAEAPTIDKIELDADGKIKNAEQYTESIKSDWADFIVTQSAKGANTATPPANGGAATTKTKEDILKIKDAGERQKAIAENPTLFGID